jgi:hypothetical protein
MEMAVHPVPEAVLAARHSTPLVAMVQLFLHAAQHQTGAAAVAAVHQLLVQMQWVPVVTADQVEHHQSQEQASLSLAAAVAAAAIAANQATPLPQVVTAEQVVAVTVVHRHGTEPAAVQALALAARLIQVAVAVAAAIALAPRSLEVTTVVAVAVDPESLSCAISSLPLQLPILKSDQTLVRHQPTTSRETKPSRLQVMHL